MATSVITAPPPDVRKGLRLSAMRFALFERLRLEQNWGRSPWSN